MTKGEILERYRDRAVISGKEFYLQFPWAREFPKECGRNELAVVGVEGFALANRKLIPKMDLIADFSSALTSDWERDRDALNKFAADFLGTWKADLLANFTILSKQDWEKIRKA